MIDTRNISYEDRNIIENILIFLEDVGYLTINKKPRLNFEDYIDQWEDLEGY